MRKRIDFLNYFIQLIIYKLEWTEGLASLIPDTDKHLCMWDFDNCSLKTVIESLTPVQNKYNLPDIHIYADNKENSYRASSPSRLTFNQLLHVLIDTPNIDRHYIEWTLKKGHATIRIGNKAGRNNQNLVYTIINNNNITDYPEKMNFERYKVIVE